MPATLETERAAEGERLLAAAEKVDAGQEVLASEISNVESAQTTEGVRAAVPKEKTTPDPLAGSDKSKTPADEAGTEDATSQQRQNSNDRRREKESVRAAPGFAALKKAEESFEARMAERERRFEAIMQERMQQPPQRRQGQGPDLSQIKKINRGRDENGNELTAEDYHALADQHESEDGGVTPRVAAARNKARMIAKEDRLIEQAERDQRVAPQAPQGQQQQGRPSKEQIDAHNAVWIKQRDEILAKETDLKEDQELFSWVSSVINEDDRTTPEIRYLVHALPHGFAIAAQIGRLMRDASSVPALRSDKARLEAENAKLNGKLGIGGDQTAGDTSKEGGKRFEQMTGPEQAAWLEKNAAEIDAAGRTR